MRLDRSTLRGELALMAFEEVANKEAIERIDQLAEAASHGARYVHARADVKIEELIPGVRARALGPPTIEQWPQMATQKTDDEEYWLRLKRMLNFSLERPGVRTLDAAAESTGLGPGPARSLVELMRNEYAHSLLRIVRTVDDTLNNTSVILFFETGTRRLLFPGDAQIENWSYALKDESTAELREGLDQVDLYKVGHHGSRNATPKSLVHLWQTGGRPVASIMSTKPKVHGETPETAVPQDKLIEALEGVGALHRTDTLPETASYLELTASTSDDQPFKAS